MVEVLSMVGVIAVIVGMVLILKALFLRAQKRFQSASATVTHDARQFALLNNGRIDTRLGMVLVVAGSTVALPEFLGLTLAPTTLTILACLLIGFLSAYSRYARQLRASQPER